jgi:protein-L-isoaspartate(D-aspartate) O-methyltransferase
MQPPMPDFAAARRAMVDSQLRPEGVTDALVVRAMASVPREDFVPDTLRALAYGDRPLSFEGQSLMPPAALGRLLSELAPRPGERALVIGRGNGYAAAILRQIGLDVAEVAEPSDKAGYDLVLIDGAVEQIPAEIIARLAPGGRLGTAIIDRGITRLAVGRSAGGSLGLRSFADAEVPVIPGFAKPRAFTF